MCAALAISDTMPAGSLPEERAVGDWREPKRCERCNLLFDPRRWSERYCIPCRASCSVEGCHNPMKSGGLCSGHWHRKMRYGDPGGAALRPARGDQKNRRPSQKSVQLTCEHCAEQFWCPPSLAGTRRFCSNACYRDDKDKKPEFECAQCGKVTVRTKQPLTQGYNYKQRFCSPECRHESLRKGGYVHRGYRYIHVAGKRAAEHRDVMERQIGRPLLADETVHHVNGDKLDNRPENLELWSGRHGRGQRVDDHVDFALDTLKLYSDVLARKGYRLIPLESAEATAVLGAPSYEVFDARTVIERYAKMVGAK
jgi:hypothetical protein